MCLNPSFFLPRNNSLVHRRLGDVLVPLLVMVIMPIATVFRRRLMLQRLSIAGQLQEYRGLIRNSQTSIGNY